MFDYRVFQDRIARLLEKDIFFIAGMSKSGTTWLQKLLDGHPEICCSGEGHLPNMLGPKLQSALLEHSEYIRLKNRMLYGTSEGFPTFSVDHVKFLFVTAACLLLDAQTAGRECRCVGEKTPNNIRALAQLADLFPTAKFIQIIRDGRDGAVSGWHHIYRDTPEEARKQYPTFAAYVTTFARQWAETTRMGRDFGRRHPERYQEVRYEDLQNDPDASLTRLLAFLGVDTSPAMVARCRESGSFRRLSGGRAPGEEDKQSHFRKGVAGDWKNHFDDNSLSVFNREAGNMLKELGYA